MLAYSMHHIKITSHGTGDSAGPVISQVIKVSRNKPPEEGRRGVFTQPLCLFPKVAFAGPDSVNPE